jgi:pyruvate/2-oxoglutarate dehydrogenase complex dihydrolipoamide acyltransferase (E2) component
VVTPIVEKIIGRAADKVADGILCSAICAVGDIVLFGPADPLADVGAGVCEVECPEGVELGITLYDTCSKIPGSPCRSPAEYIATNVCKKLEEAAADAEAAAKQAAADAEAAAEAAAKQAAADAEAAAEATAKQIAADAEIAKCVLCAYLCC